ncbi:MAG: ribonuclease III domain-containing protein [Eubacteriales bacterium]|nr:ribonuclease III domain-containing protein [Eubacteriales bacterium]MDD3866872.1 ribonuclease III domain-containing protein [Eubacteriales bacterium]MDD4461905.1 ribonuclease III domain-containing protein [Eubacteriales bacterium]
MSLPEFSGDIREVPVSVLAYIGDAVYELQTRLYLFNHVTGQSGRLHQQSIGLVSASAQARAARLILPRLTPEEEAIFRRGRNSQSGSMPKHADPVDYQSATGFEALIGYLYLTGQHERIDRLLRMIYEGDEHEATANEP